MRSIGPFAAITVESDPEVFAALTYTNTLEAGAPSRRTLRYLPMGIGIPSSHPQLGLRVFLTEKRL